MKPLHQRSSHSLKENDILIVGAGFSGAVVARELAEAGLTCTVIDQRQHIGGNCHTARDANTGIMVHHYGPHVFHTDKPHVWKYVNRFAEMRSYVSRIKTTVNGEVYSLPINLHTINQFFKTALSPAEAEAFIKEKTITFPHEPRNFEEQALSMVGLELYQAFFKGYTEKQWGLPPTAIPASVLKRLPLRFDYNDSYFNHSHQAIPEQGYTKLIENILDHPNIVIALETTFHQSNQPPFAHTFYTGPIDQFFNYQEGRLAYRTLQFEHHQSSGNHQGLAIMNHADASTPHTRITEHKHFAYWEKHIQTLYTKEYSQLAQEGDIPYYPIRHACTQDNAMIQRYEALAAKEADTTFLGRLGTYRYLDMDQTIHEALEIAQQYLARKNDLASQSC